MVLIVEGVRCEIVELPDHTLSSPTCMDTGFRVKYIPFKVWL